MTPLTAKQKRKRRDYLRAQGVKFVAVAPPDLYARAASHLDVIRKRGASLELVAERTGLSISTVHRLVLGRPVSPSTAKKILDLTPGSVDDARRMTGAEFVWAVRTLQAVGYTVRWQENTAGLSRGSVSFTLGRVARGEQRGVEPKVAMKMRALHARYSMTVATPSTVPTSAGVIARTVREARERGYYPAAAYNEDGTLDWRAIPDHPWVLTDEWCHGRIEQLRLIVAHPDLGGEALATVILEANPNAGNRHTIDKQIERLLDRLHLRPSHEGGTERRAALNEELWRFFRRGDKTPVQFCLDNGIADVKATEIARDHPDLLASRQWKDRQERLIANRKASKQRENDRKKRLRAEARAAVEAGQPVAA